MELPAVARDPYGGADPAPSLADAELGPNVGSAISLHDGPVVDAVEAVKDTTKALAGGSWQVTLATKCHP